MASRVYLSEHAIERFAERVRPTLTPDAARAELERLLPQAEPVAELDWHTDHVEDPPDRYLVISDGVALAVIGKVAVTVLTRAEHHPNARYAKSLRRKKQRRHKKENNLNSHGRGSHRKRARMRAEGR